jgi:hypothetical protein
MPEAELKNIPGASLLRLWLEQRRDNLIERLPGLDAEREVRQQLAALAAGGAGETGRREEITSSLPVTAALALWRVLRAVVEQGLDLLGEDEESLAILAAETGDESQGELGASVLLELARGFLASDGRCPLTPEAFGARLQRQPPDRLELPDGVTLTGASLAAFRHPFAAAGSGDPGGPGPARPGATEHRARAAGLAAGVVPRRRRHRLRCPRRPAIRRPIRHARLSVARPGASRRPADPPRCQ